MSYTAIAYALQLLNALPQLVQAGIDITAAVSSAKSKLELMQSENRNPTEAEWQELNDSISALRKELHS